MKIAIINSVPYGSTGRIMFSTRDLLEKEGNEVITFSGYSWKKEDSDKHYIIGGLVSKSIHMLFSIITGLHGYASFFSTVKLLVRLHKFQPDIIQLHNIHGWYLNYSLLFRYLKQTNSKIVWTLHDCWAFTGGCAHFEFAQCNQWKFGCSNCNEIQRYPIKSIVDRTRKLYNKKKKWINDLNNLTLITPSNWLAKLVEQSFLFAKPVIVINNGIDLNVFKPTMSNFRASRNLLNKKIVLGVSMGWDNRKGLDTFIELAKRLNDEYQVVLVGTDNDVDKVLPSNVISIHRTHSQKELAELYSTADVFVNPTKEDTFPTVNIEALACGLPVITYDVGGSPEIINNTCGFVVDRNNIVDLLNKITYVCENKPFSHYACRLRAQQYKQENRFMDYIKLYEELHD